LASTTNHYDLIVLGSDIAGLVAAALVARRGRRVLVMPHGQADGVYRLGGHILPLETAPVVHMTTPPVRRVFQELGLLQQVRRQHASIDGLLHYVLPGHRIDLEPEGSNLADEAGREWPGTPVTEAWALQARWSAATDEVLDQLLDSEKALVAEGFWGRRALSRVAAQLPARQVDELEPLSPGHPMRAAAVAHLPWLQHVTPVQLGKAAALRLCGLWNAGPEDLPNGERQLRKLLLQRIELHSGEVKRDLRIGEVLVRRGRVVGASLLGKRDRYGCDHMIVASDPRRMLDGTFLPEQLPKALATALVSIAAIAHRFVMHLEIDARGLSPALAGMVVCLPDPSCEGDAKGPRDSDEDTAAWAEHGVGHTYIRVEPGSEEHLRRLSITHIVPAGVSLDTLREEILEELDQRGILPFCRSYIRFLHSPHDNREATDGTGMPLEHLGPGSAMTLPMAPIYGMHGDPVLGVGVLPNGSGLRALHLASRLTLPGLGLEGEFAAGTAAAGLVANPAKTPFSRSPLLSRA
jgi:hypothetical protein